MDKSLYSWKDDPENLVTLNPFITKTLTLRANYLLDVKHEHAKNNLLIHVNCHPFPDGL